MVGALTRMRWSLLRNSLSGMQAATIGLGAVGGLALAAVGLWVGALGAPAPDLLAGLFLAWMVGWAAGPVLLGGSAGSLAPEFFAAMPVSPPRLARGLLASSFLGVGPVVTAVAFAAGVVFATRIGSGAVAVSVGAMLLQLLVVITLSKVVVDLLGAALTSTARAVVAAIPWALLGGVVAQSWLLLPLVSSWDGLHPAASATLRVLPSGWGLAAIEAAGEGRWLLAAGSLAGLVVLLVLLVRWWAWLIVRRTTSVVTVRPASARGDGRAGVRGGLQWLLPANPIGAVAAKELRTSVRDLNRALMLAYAVFFGLSVTLVPVVVGERIYLAASGVIVALLATTGSAQLYGNDGTALWMTTLIPASERADIRGRQLAWLLLVGPLTIVLTAVGVWLSGAGWAAPWAWSLLPAALGGGAGLIVLVSVFVLVPVADPRKRARSAVGGDSSMGLVAWAMLPLSLVVVLPAAVLPLAGHLVDNAPLQWAGVPVGLLTGAASAVLLGRLAHQRLARSGPEMLTAMRSGGAPALDLSGRRTGVGTVGEPVRRSIPVARVVGAWALYLVGFVLVVAQVVVALVLLAVGVTSPTWFLALYLPADWRTAGLVGLALLGVLAVVAGWGLTRGYPKAARKRYGLP